MGHRITFGVGAHEPIFHRLRTGNSAADEWDRWLRETSGENLDLLSELGVGHVLIACTKGFGLEAEKPVIERAARFAERATERGIATNIYVQGFPIYYETFLLETPAAADWLARTQSGEIIPWGGQTFRRWIDPTRKEFWDYQRRMLTYVLDQFTPTMVFMDNTQFQPCYTDSAVASLRDYLRMKFADADPVREFGIPSFDAVDLPRFDPIYWPRDAYRVVKDPLMQEWACWRADLLAEFLGEMMAVVKAKAPRVLFGASSGCDGLRTNQLFNAGVDFEKQLTVLDRSWMEEAGWRPGAYEPGGDARRVVMDQRIAIGSTPAESAEVRVSTDSRWWKLASHYGLRGHGGLWGEVDRDAKLIALAHNFAFAADPTDLGAIGPLAAAPGMFDDVADVIEWGHANPSALAGRDDRYGPVVVWRSTSTQAFIRHRPVWAACAVEQMLYERHVPFTIALDGVLEACLTSATLLVCPQAECISDAQAETIIAFVRCGGALLLLGPCGTRDERTRVRRGWAFTELFGESMPDIEHFGPPHWVPELDFSAMPETLSASFGDGHVAFVREITSAGPLDETRDPYSPERKVAPKDILPPANADEIMSAVTSRVGDLPRVEAPAWTLCEFWRRGSDLLVACANLSRGRPGGPVTLHLGDLTGASAAVHEWFSPPRPAEITGGAVRVDAPGRFCAIEVAGVF